MRTSSPRFVIRTERSMAAFAWSSCRRLSAFLLGTATTRMRSTKVCCRLQSLPRYVYEGRAASARIMRAAALALGVLLVVALLLPTAKAEDFGAVTKVSGLIRVKETPQLAPGDSGRFIFYFNSTYTVPIQNVTLKASIYRYATIDASIPVNDTSWTYPFPKIQESGSLEWVWTNTTVTPGSSRLLNFTILTAADSSQMPHGTIFSQSPYFVRFWLEVAGDGGGNPTRRRTRGRGRAVDLPGRSPLSAGSRRSRDGRIAPSVLGVSRGADRRSHVRLSSG